MQGVAVENKAIGQSSRPAGADEFQVALLGRAVDFVPEDRVADVCCVDADLVGAAGDRAGFKQCQRACVAGCSLENAEAGRGLRALRVHHAFEVDAGGGDFALADDRGIHAEGFPLRVAMDEGEIGFGDAALLHGDGRRSRGGGVFCHQNDAAGFAVQAIDEGDLPGVRDFVGEEVAQAVPQGSWPIRLARVDEESRRFFDRNQIGCLAKDAEVCLIAVHLE